METYKTTGRVEIFPQKGGWVYVRIPAKITRKLVPKACRGLIPVEAMAGATTWKTSLMPMGDGTHFVALKARVRKIEHIEIGKMVTISFRAR
jgi:hypothetical protein